MKVDIARWLTLSSYLGLIAFSMLWAIWLAGLPESKISMRLILFVPPLLIPLRGVLALNDKKLVWGSLVSLIYMVDGGVTLWADSVHQHLGALEMALALTYIFSSSFFIRWRAEANAAS